MYSKKKKSKTMTNIGEIAGHGHSAGEKHHLISNPRKLQLRLLTGQRVLGKRNEASWRPRED